MAEWEIIGGMLANICVEPHLRELLEQGFEITVVRDGTGGLAASGWGDGYLSTGLLGRKRMDIIHAIGLTAH